MSNTPVSFVASQLAYLAPSLVVYLLAFILALVFLRRAFLPSILTLLGTTILGLSIFSQMAVQAYFIQNHLHDGMNVVAFVGSCIRGVGMVLLVAAIFVGRATPNTTFESKL